MKLTDRLVEREPAREAHPEAVGGDLLEVGRGGGAQLFLDVAPAARRDHDRVTEPELLHQPRFELLPAGEVELDADEALVERALEQARDRRRRDAERPRDVLLAPAPAVVQLEAVDRLPELAWAEGDRRLHAGVVPEINFISINFLLDATSLPRYPRTQAPNLHPHHARRRACLRVAMALRTASRRSS